MKNVLIGMLIGFITVAGVAFAASYSPPGGSAAFAGDPPVLNSHLQTESGPSDLSRTNIVGETTTAYLELNCQDNDGCQMSTMTAPTVLHTQICVGIQGGGTTADVILVHNNGAAGGLLLNGEVNFDLDTAGIDRACFQSCQNGAFLQWCSISLTDNG